MKKIDENQKKKKDLENGFDNLAGYLLKDHISKSAPERERELSQLWDEYSLTIDFNRTDDSGFKLEAGFGAIRFNQRSLHSLWILGFAAQKAFQLYYPFITYCQIFCFKRLPRISENDEESQRLSQECQLLLSSIHDLIQIEKSDDFVWPKGVPEPKDGKPQEIDNQITFDLNCIAAAFCFLHEIRHIQFNQKCESHNPQEEEIQCDTYACDFLIEKIEDYSKTSGYAVRFLKNRRGMGIILAAVLALLITPSDKWLDSASHPPLIKRISNIMELLDIPDNDGCWLYFSCLLLALLEQKKVGFQIQWVINQKEFCLDLLRQLELVSTKNTMTG